MTKAKREKMEKTGRYMSKDPRNGKKMPKKASKRVEKAWELLMSKDSETIRCYGVGYRVLWSVPACRKRMKRNGFKPPGEYDKNTLMDGKVYGTPAEASFLTGKLCSDVLHDAYSAGVSKSRLEKASRCLSLGYQLKYQKKGAFPEVTDLWRNNMFPYKMGKPSQTIMSKVFLPAACVKILFTTPWHPGHRHALPWYSVLYLVDWDSILMGARSNSDLERLQVSRSHTLCKSGGWLSTDYWGGRAKHEKKNGDRPWKAYRTCMCKAGMHQGLPEKSYKEVRKMFDSKTGNPVGDGWKMINTACPLTCFEIIQHWLMRSGEEMGRCYPKWSPAQSMGNRKAKWKPRIKFQKDDIGMKSIHKVRFEFIDAQGANPDRLKMLPNSGRKSLGHLCEVESIPEDVSFHLHGNRHKNWCFYQRDVRRVPGFSQRFQSGDPNTCIQAHVMLRNAWGLGPDEPPPPAPPEVQILKTEVNEIKRKLGDVDALKSTVLEMKQMMMQQFELLQKKT